MVGVVVFLVEKVREERRVKKNGNDSTFYSPN